jgi:hypothetical protein
MIRFFFTFHLVDNDEEEGGESVNDEIRMYISREK